MFGEMEKGVGRRRDGGRYEERDRDGGEDRGGRGREMERGRERRRETEKCGYSDRLTGSTHTHTHSLARMSVKECV